VRQLVEMAGSVHGEAGRCAEAGCWRAALVLIGSALEAGITATACCFEPELRERKLWPRDDLTRWTLGEAIDLALGAGWLPSQRPGADFIASLDGDVGDAVKFVNHLRNMAIHPGAYARESMRPDFDDVQHMRLTYETFDGIMATVFERLSEVVKCKIAGV
jgi:hypothetical protein